MNQNCERTIQVSLKIANYEGKISCITLPTTPTILQIFVSKIVKEKSYLKEINCNIDILINEKNSIINGIELLDLIIQLQYKLEDLNCLSNEKEVQAISEIFTDNIDEIFKKLKNPNFHFYSNESLEDIAGRIFDVDLSQEENFEEIMSDKGYFETSTGVIKIV